MTNGYRRSRCCLHLDHNLLELLGVPKELHDLCEFIELQFAHKDGFLPIFTKVDDFNEWRLRNKLSDWRIILPCKLPGQRVELPLPDSIDEDDPLGHWRAILAAAADFQSLVNTGEYSLCSRSETDIVSPQNTPDGPA